MLTVTVAEERQARNERCVAHPPLWVGAKDSTECRGLLSEHSLPYNPPGAAPVNSAQQVPKPPTDRPHAPGGALSTQLFRLTAPPIARSHGLFFSPGWSGRKR